MKAGLLQLSLQVGQSLETSVAALLSGAARERATSPSQAADEIDLRIEDASAGLLALHQPIGRDLRLLSLARRISSELELIGEYALRIADTAEGIPEAARAQLPPQIGEMARHAREMLADALDALARGDPDAAREVCVRDRIVDALHRSVVRVLLTHLLEDPRRMKLSLLYLQVAGHLERSGDIAVRVAEDAVFVAEGRAPRAGGAAGRPRP